MLGAPIRRLAHWVRRRVVTSDHVVLVVLLALVTACGILPATTPSWVPVTSLVVPILLGGLALRMPTLLLLYVATFGVLVAQERAREPDGVTPGTAGVVATVALVVLIVARGRTRLGVQGTRGETMLFDLRDRLRAQGKVPLLPDRWHVEADLRPAGGESFSGDFVVATRGSVDGRHLEIALVDVSGKGLDAGARALLLSGAFGGLLGSLPACDFLRAANGYLLRQSWPEGFATAVHVVLDLDTGAYELRSAGHPPGAHWKAGADRWDVVQPEGLLLGVLDGAEYEPVHGVLDPGDAFLLFTDGMVELPGQDISDGIDHLLGVAEQLVPEEFHDGARRIVELAGRNVGDDRAVVLVRRRPGPLRPAAPRPP